MRNEDIIVALTGGGTGGHMYPLIAVADELQRISGNGITLVYLGPENPINKAFGERDIHVYTTLSSKWRRYMSIENILDIPKFILSFFQALFLLYWIMPDVVFSKGGPGALAVVIAAKVYFIPVVIHESDTIPGLTNRLSAPFAKRIGIAFKAAAVYFPAKKTAIVGNPVRAELLAGRNPKDVAKRNLGLNPTEPLLLVLGGSQGATRINSFVFENMEALLAVTQVCHQVGENNVREAQVIANETLGQLPEVYQNKYRMTGLFDVTSLREAFSACDVVISRAGAGAIFEIAAFAKPAILVPLDGSANDHQRLNAYEYSKTGAAVVIEEDNFSIHIVMRQLEEFLKNPQTETAIQEGAHQFFKTHTIGTLAEEILRLAHFFS